METQATEQRARARLLTVPEVAELLSVPKSWVYGHVASGDMPHLKVGRYVRFTARDVMAWLEARNA